MTEITGNLRYTVSSARRINPMEVYSWSSIAAAAGLAWRHCRARFKPICRQQCASMILTDNDQDDKALAIYVPKTRHLRKQHCGCRFQTHVIAGKRDVGLTVSKVIATPVLQQCNSHFLVNSTRTSAGNHFSAHNIVSGHGHEEPRSGNGYLRAAPVLLPVRS